MGVLLPNYPEENVVKSACGENVPNNSTSTGTGTSSNVFQILQDLWLKQYQGNQPDSLQSESRTSRTSITNTTCTTAQMTHFRTYGSATANQNTGTVTHNTSMCCATARQPPFPVNYVSWFPSKFRGKVVPLTESPYSS